MASRLFPFFLPPTSCFLPPGQKRRIRKASARCVSKISATPNFFLRQLPPLAPAPAPIFPARGSPPKTIRSAIAAAAPAPSVERSFVWALAEDWLPDQAAASSRRLSHPAWEPEAERYVKNPGTAAASPVASAIA